MIVKPGMVTIQDNSISLDKFKLTEDTPIAIGRIEVLNWAKQEIELALKVLNKE